MKIGFSFVDLALGGAQTMLVQLAGGLATRGHSLCYYVYAKNDDRLHRDPSLVQSLRAVAQTAPSPHDFLACQVIQLDGFHSLLKKRHFLPVFHRCVETYHSAYSIRRSGPVYPSHRVAVSQDVLTRLRLPAQVIYPGIPIPDMPAANQREFDLAILGRIHPVKQHLLFLQACEQVYRQRGMLSALLIGGHPAQGAYQQQVDREIERLRKAGLSITVTGAIPPADVPKYLFQTRLLLVTSREEGFGRMAVEALACEVPVISNPTGGLLEIIQDGETGVFARQNDPASFAEKAVALLEDSSRRERMGSAGRAEAMRRFSLPAMVDAYERLYEGFIKQPPGGR